MSASCWTFTVRFYRLLAFATKESAISGWNMQSHRFHGVSKRVREFNTD
jgi:hypothetical protein